MFFSAPHAAWWTWNETSGHGENQEGLAHSFYIQGGQQTLLSEEIYNKYVCQKKGETKVYLFRYSNNR